MVNSQLNESSPKQDLSSWDVACLGKESARLQSRVSSCRELLTPCQREVFGLCPIHLSTPKTAGGIYYQAYELGGRRWGPLACWWTGWLDWAAYVSGIAAVNYIFAQFVGVIVLLATDGNHELSAPVQFAISCFAAGVELLLNLLPIRTLGFVETLGAFWTLCTSLLLIVIVPSIAPSHRSASYVFTEFIDNSAASGLDSPAYLFCLGLLMSQFSLTGYDVNGHISEETKNSDRNAAWSTITSVVSAIVLGFGLLLAITFSIQDPNNVLSPDNQTKGLFAAPQIYYDIFQARYGSGVGAVALIALVTLCCIFGNTGGTAAGSRLFWAMSRDKATPFAPFWAYLTPGGKVPVPAMILTSVGSILFTLPVCWSSVAFTAINSFTTVATYLAYGLPILMKVTLGRKRFRPGPLSLGSWSLLVNVVALAWIVTISVLFCLPTVYPVSWQTLNYAPVAFGGIFMFITLPWLLPKALFNFRGPLRDFGKDDGGALEDHFGADDLQRGSAR